MRWSVTRSRGTGRLKLLFTRTFDDSWRARPARPHRGDTHTLIAELQRPFPCSSLGMSGDKPLPAMRVSSATRRAVNLNTEMSQMAARHREHQTNVLNAKLDEAGAFATSATSVAASVVERSSAQLKKMKSLTAKRVSAESKGAQRRAAHFMELKIDPRGQKAEYWSWFAGVALVCVAFATPYEVGFVQSSKCGVRDGWYIVNRTFDVIFIIDMVLQSITMCATSLEAGQPYTRSRPALLPYTRLRPALLPYTRSRPALLPYTRSRPVLLPYTRSRPALLPYTLCRFKEYHPTEGWRWVRSHRRMVVHYLTGWFAIDALGMISSASA